MYSKKRRRRWIFLTLYITTVKKISSELSWGKTIFLLNFHFPPTSILGGRNFPLNFKTYSSHWESSKGGVLIRRFALLDILKWVGRSQKKKYVTKNVMFLYFFKCIMYVMPHNQMIFKLWFERYKFFSKSSVTREIIFWC